MADLLIRDVPDEVVSAIDIAAKRLGLSRAAYLRRQVTQAARPTVERVTREDLAVFASAVADLDDPAVMSHAWR